MGLTRREFTRLGIAAIPAVLGAAAVGRLLRDGEIETVGPVYDGATDPSTWGQLTSLVDDKGRGAYAVHAVLAPDGRVLAIGGADADFLEFWLDPRSLTRVTEVPPIPLPLERSRDYLECAGHAYLDDGRLLVAGGSRSDGDEREEGLDYALLLDQAGMWERVVEPMAGGRRWYPTVTRLPDSTLLVTTGFFDFGEEANLSIELFDPEAHGSGSSPWRELISHEQNEADIAPTGEDYTQVHLLSEPVSADGHARQLAMIGKAGVVTLFSYSDSFADPNERFSVPNNGRRPGPAGAELGAGASSLLLADGRIMIVGGSEDGFVQSRADIYDPRADSWESIETLVSRLYPTALLLPDGTVLVTSGEQGRRGDPRTPQIIDPRSGEVTNSQAWPEADGRGYHNIALLLPDARILIGGGAGREPATPNNERTDLRIFSPPYLERSETRPAIQQVPARIPLGESFEVRYENGPIDGAALLGLGAMTHCFDQNQRLIELPVEEPEPGLLRISGPTDAAAAPPGDYMLFLIRRVEEAKRTIGVPSTAAILRVDQP